MNSEFESAIHEMHLGTLVFPRRMLGFFAAKYIAYQVRGTVACFIVFATLDSISTHRHAVP